LTIAAPSILSWVQVREYFLVPVHPPSLTQHWLRIIYKGEYIHKLKLTTLNGCGMKQRPEEVPTWIRQPVGRHKKHPRIQEVFPDS
jgi:hypothetical protein